MQKVNELYESYYELYSQINYNLEDAKGLLQECEPILRHFSVEFQLPTFDNEILFRQKKHSDTPI